MTARETVAYWEARGVPTSAELRAAAAAEQTSSPSPSTAATSQSTAYTPPIVEELYGIDAKGQRITSASLKASRYSQLFEEGAKLTSEGMMIHDAYLAIKATTPRGRAEALGINIEAVR